jgi:hypothetical protein
MSALSLSIWLMELSFIFDGGDEAINQLSSLFDRPFHQAGVQFGVKQGVVALDVLCRKGSPYVREDAAVVFEGSCELLDC